MKYRLFAYIGLGSIAYAVAIVWGGAWLFYYLKSRPFPIQDEAGTFLFQTIIALLPFCRLLYYVVFKLKVEITQNTKQRIYRSAFTGLVCSLALWSLYYYDGFTYSGQGGANIGLGILMLLSPILIFEVMRWVFNRSKSKNE